ncbi:MAG: hypothetical protein ACE368_03570, partial [Paracoccaceae bacterium]
MANMPGILLGGWLVKRGAGVLSLVALASLTMMLCIAGIFPDVLPPAARLGGLAVLFSLAGGRLPPPLFNAVPAARSDPLDLPPPDRHARARLGAGPVHRRPHRGRVGLGGGNATRHRSLPMTVAAA